MREMSLWVRGVAAGAVGATVLAFWFLVVDAAQGVPFRTPALLASSILSMEGLETRPGLITLYTVLHYAAFMGMGVVVAWLLDKIKRAPSILLGLVLGLLLFNIVFYSSVTITGVDVVNELGWVEVLAGNLLAGVSLMAFLQATGVVRPVTIWAYLVEHRVVREGIVAGLLGGLAVALWFLVVDAVHGRPFFTPAALGSALFLGATDLATIEVTLWTVAGYSVIHFSAFIVVGFVASAIAGQAEETPPLILGAILLFVAFEALFLGLLAAVAEFLLGPLAWWSIALGNVLAVAAMGYYLWLQHPKLKEALAADPFDRTS